ncbi:MAG: single-stranded DNA-binding protein [Desulfatitalea sp.]|nr:single-stranded DNA-binding protein [Desulfatitalea sp.]
MEQIIDTLVARLRPLRFAPPVHTVYNPLIYARSAHLAYWRRCGQPPKEILLVGMNPGPWGMVQTGVPFGDVCMVTQWLGLPQPVTPPAAQHPKRPILGLDCTRREVSGQRLWGWAQQRFGTPERFFKRFGVANYCPLAFLEAGGRNITPDKLPAKEKAMLFDACDEALAATVHWLCPTVVVGVGVFAAQQARRVLAQSGVRVGQITHPSPANPKANAGWSLLVEKELYDMGIVLKTASGEQEA